MKALIVDDEPLARARLERLLFNLPFFHQIFQACDGVEALEKLSKKEVDVVFLDINMPNLDGLAVAEALKKAPIPPALIFTTAHSEFAFDALSFVPQGYLLKPIELQQLEKVLSQLKQTNRGFLESTKGHKITYRLAGNTHTINLDDVLYCQADDKYVKVYHRNGSAIIEQSLKQLEQLFSFQLLRVHRNTLINKAHIVAIISEKGEHWVELDGVVEKLMVSRRQWRPLKEAFES